MNVVKRSFIRSQISQTRQVLLDLCVDRQQLLSDLLDLISNVFTVDLIMTSLLLNLRFNSCTLSKASCTPRLLFSLSLRLCIISLSNGLLVAALALGKLIIKNLVSLC